MTAPGRLITLAAAACRAAQASPDWLELRQQVAWDLAGAVHAILGWPRPVPGTWPEPFLDCSPGPALADLAAHPGCRLPLHRPGCPDWRP